MTRGEKFTAESRDGQDVHQKPPSKSDFILSGTKRPRYDQLTDSVQSAYEWKKYNRLVEKCRRDRINECIYQLKDLLPAGAISSTSKPMEKAVILEFVVKYIQNVKQKDRKSSEYVRGYKECSDRVLRYLNPALDEQRQEELAQHLKQDMPLPKQKNETTTTITPPTSLPSNLVNEEVEDDQSISSYLSSSSSISDFSLCADNSDSSACQGINDHKFAKRKMYSRHHRASRPHSTSQAKRQPTSVAGGTTAQGQSPVFINMPLMMAPNMMPTPQFMGPNGAPISTKPPTPRLVQSYPVTTPTSVVSQMNGGSNHVQFPSFVMTCGPQHMSEGQPQLQNQVPQVNPIMFRPTMMMPVQNQGNFVFMPSYPMIPHFQTPTLIPMQTSTEEQTTSPSE